MLQIISVIIYLNSSCPGGQNSSKPCSEGYYNDLPGQSDIAACKVTLWIDIVLGCVSSVPSQCQLIFSLGCTWVYCKLY